MQTTGELTSELLEQWAVWMRGAGMSERTVSNRLSLVDHLGRYAGIEAALAEWQHLAEFLGRDATPLISPSTRASGRAVPVTSGRRISPGTRAVNYADLHSWFSWLQAMGYRSDNPVDRLHKPRGVKRSARPISTAQLERVLATVNRRRTRAMLLLGAYQGLRVHEIAKLRGEDIDGPWLSVVGKGSKPARLPLHPAVAAIAHDFPRYDWWFPAYGKPGPVSANSVCNTISKLMKRAEVNGTAHQLRHWFGTEVLRASGGNTRVAQELLRHESLTSTQIYTFVDDDECRAAVLGLPGFGGADRRRLRVVSPADDKRPSPAKGWRWEGRSDVG